LFNHELFKRLGSELGILGITVSEQFGGAGLDATAVAIALEEICSADPG
jgi:isovaleryl-CoA dehydrogenase